MRWDYCIEIQCILKMSTNFIAPENVKSDVIASTERF